MPIKKRRVSAREVSLQKQRDNILKMRVEIDKLSAMRKTIKGVISKTGLIGAGRNTIMFDYLFSEIEPNKVKRRGRLNRIFRLAPKLEDAEWVTLIHRNLLKLRTIKNNNQKKML